MSQRIWKCTREQELYIPHIGRILRNDMHNTYGMRWLYKSSIYANFHAKYPEGRWVHDVTVTSQKSPSKWWYLGSISIKLTISTIKRREVTVQGSLIRFSWVPIASGGGFVNFSSWFILKLCTLKTDLNQGFLPLSINDMHLMYHLDYPSVYRHHCSFVYRQKNLICREDCSVQSQCSDKSNNYWV